MAKQPKTRTPVRQVRSATGLSQKQFADLVGINYNTYESIELGRVKISQVNAEKISSSTGALRNSLDPIQSNRAMSLADPCQPYSARTWRMWNKRERPKLEIETSRLAISLVGWTQLLCIAALKQTKFVEAHTFLANALRKCAAECNLDMKGFLASQLKHHRQILSYSYGELRQNQELARAVGFKDRSHNMGQIVSNDAIWKTNIPLARMVQWDPLGPIPQSLLHQLNCKLSWHKAGQAIRD